MALAWGTQQLCCKATQARCCQVWHCSHVLVDRQNLGGAALSDSEWSDEVCAWMACSWPLLLLECLQAHLLSLIGQIGVGGDWKSLMGVGVASWTWIGAEGCGVASLGVSNGVARGADAAAGNEVATCSLGDCNGAGWQRRQSNLKYLEMSWVVRCRYDSLHLGEKAFGLFVISRLSNQPFFVIVIVIVIVIMVIYDVLIRWVLEQLKPTIIIWCRNGGKPVGEDMNLWNNVARMRIQDEGNWPCLLVGEPEVDSARRAVRSARQLLPVWNHLVKDVHRAPPNVYLCRLSLFPSDLCEDVRGREASPRVRHLDHWEQSTGVCGRLEWPIKGIHFLLNTCCVR